MNHHESMFEMDRKIQELEHAMTANDEYMQKVEALNAELVKGLKDDSALSLFIESTLNSVALPSGNPALSRVFADIRSALLQASASRRALIAKAETRK